MSSKESGILIFTIGFIFRFKNLNILMASIACQNLLKRQSLNKTKVAVLEMLIHPRVQQQVQGKLQIFM